MSHDAHLSRLVSFCGRMFTLIRSVGWDKDLNTCIQIADATHNLSRLGKLLESASERESTFPHDFTALRKELENHISVFAEHAQDHKAKDGHINGLISDTFQEGVIICTALRDHFCALPTA